jgi:hypothetical protein
LGREVVEPDWYSAVGTMLMLGAGTCSSFGVPSTDKRTEDYRELLKPLECPPLAEKDTDNLGRRHPVGTREWDVPPGPPYEIGDMYIGGVKSPAREGAVLTPKPTRSCVGDIEREVVKRAPGKWNSAGLGMGTSINGDAMMAVGTSCKKISLLAEVCAKVAQTRAAEDPSHWAHKYRPREGDPRSYPPALPFVSGVGTGLCAGDDGTGNGDCLGSAFEVMTRAKFHLVSHKGKTRLTSCASQPAFKTSVDGGLLTAFGLVQSDLQLMAKAFGGQVPAPPFAGYAPFVERYLHATGEGDEIRNVLTPPATADANALFRVRTGQPVGAESWNRYRGLCSAWTGLHPQYAGAADFYTRMASARVADARPVIAYDEVLKARPRESVVHLELQGVKPPVAPPKQAGRESGGADGGRVLQRVISGRAMVRTDAYYAKRREAWAPTPEAPVDPIAEEVDEADVHHDPDAPPTVPDARRAHAPAAAEESFPDYEEEDEEEVQAAPEPLTQDEIRAKMAENAETARLPVWHSDRVYLPAKYTAGLPDFGAGENGGWRTAPSKESLIRDAVDLGLLDDHLALSCARLLARDQGQFVEAFRRAYPDQELPLPAQLPKEKALAVLAGRF